MSYFIELPTYKDPRGSLTVIDDAACKLPFEVKRIFSIHRTTDEARGGHKHYKTHEAVICISGSCVITTHEDGQPKKDYVLDTPEKCLIVEAQEWRVLHSFSPDAVLFVMASWPYEKADYIYEPAQKNSHDPLRRSASVK
ncbi:MAG: FdtA/QdtA family cupin domain-containing protein [Puia sp.]|nr:FdtA/QdtA family cupin domain-containing protein [Puia sp.]